MATFQRDPISHTVTPRYIGDFINNITNFVNAIVAGSTSFSSISVAGDITDTSAGSGLVVTTPDGTKTYRIAIDNSGQITSQELT